MKTITVEMTKIDLKTGERKNFTAQVSSTPDEAHHTYSLTYEGYRSEWKEVK